MALVQWVLEAKGFRFSTLDSGTDVFVHFSDISAKGHKKLNQGDVVELEVAKGLKGDKAVDVVVLEHAQASQLDR